jgi:hypothetical protein
MELHHSTKSLTSPDYCGPAPSALDFSPLPWQYWPLVVLTLVCYVVLTQVVKELLIRWAWVEGGAERTRAQ